VLSELVGNGVMPGQVALSRDVLAQAPIPMAITDAGGGVLWANAATTALAGREQVESLSEVLHPEDLSTSGAALERLLRHETDWQTWQERWVQPDGAVRWVWVHAIRATTPDGAEMLVGEPPLPAVVRQVIDVTEARTARAELDQALAELRSRNAELERSNEELTTFAYIASHDLSEPLRVISGHVELLSRRYSGQLDAEADRFIQFAVEGCGRMRDLIQDLLRYSRSGRELTATEVDLASVVTRAAADLAHAVADVEGTITIEGELPVVTGDRLRLGQVMTNLISNAMKFARPGHPPTVRIAAEQGDDGWVITVSDDGVGVPAEHRERAFGIFQRLQTRDVPGTGIGLAICRKVIAGHGGRIWIEDGMHGGTAVRFQLPHGVSA
jgi:PAS domain S-box-containing protein